MGALAAMCLAVNGQPAGALSGAPGIDMGGSWSPAPHEESFADPQIAEYLGVPINDRARIWALAWSPSRLTLPEHQCQVHVTPYIYGGPLNLRIWEEKDPQSQRVVAIRHYISTYEQNRTIWMDGRPHPPEGRHAHLDGILDGQVGRQHAHGVLYASQTGLAAPQRLAGK